MIDLVPADLAEIRRILDRHISDCEVRAFGSRVQGHATKYSDLDLAIVAAQPLAETKLAELKDAFAASNLPFQIDVMDWHSLPEHFRETIKTAYEILTV